MSKQSSNGQQNAATSAAPGPRSGPPRQSALATASAAPRLSPAVNDFALKIATVNGTGSASANGLLMQAIFRMGIPVSGKNIFPSNIQGLPTWYEIRVNGNGHVARTGKFQLVVAMNSQTYKKDVDELQPGGYLLYDSSWPLDTRAAARRCAFPGHPAGSSVQRASSPARASACS